MADIRQMMDAAGLQLTEQHADVILGRVARAKPDNSRVAINGPSAPAKGRGSLPIPTAGEHVADRMRFNVRTKPHLRLHVREIGPMGRPMRQQQWCIEHRGLRTAWGFDIQTAYEYARWGAFRFFVARIGC